MRRIYTGGLKYVVLLQRFQIQLTTKKHQNNNMAGVQALPALAGKACTPAIIRTT